MPKPSRRELLTGGAAGAALLAAKTTSDAFGKPPKTKDKKDRWILGMNTSTIRPAPLEEKIKVTAAAGFDTLELWIGDIDKYEKSGKSDTETDAHLDSDSHSDYGNASQIDGAADITTYLNLHNNNAHFETDRQHNASEAADTANADDSSAEDAGCTSFAMGTP